jgi:hypothetical protein
MCVAAAIALRICLPSSVFPVGNVAVFGCASATLLVCVPRRAVIREVEVSVQLPWWLTVKNDIVLPALCSSKLRKLLCVLTQLLQAYVGSRRDG